jgi:hypothetical protein
LHHNVHTEQIAGAEKQLAEAQQVFQSMLKASGAAKQVQLTFQTLPGIAAQTAAACC